MGLLIYDALVLAKTASTLDQPRRVLTLGAPTLNFRSQDLVNQLLDYPDLASRMPKSWEFEDYKGFFKGLGFSEIDVLDISDYEGANVIGDLNHGGLAGQIGRTYDLIYDSGTIEHIFDAPTALRTLASLVRIGGAIVHATPTNGFMDHGLWQLSPDLFRTFYRSAGFSVLTSAVFVFADRPYAVQADQNFYRQHGRKYIVERFPEAIAVFAAIKTRDVSAVRIEMQDYYQSMHKGAASDHASSFFLEFGSQAVANKIQEDPAPRSSHRSLRSVCAAMLQRLANYPHRER
jgi:hypothetical protein